jgi:hypothetical protein
MSVFDLLELEAPLLEPRPLVDPRPRLVGPLPPRVLLPPGSGIFGVVDHE